MADRLTTVRACVREKDITHRSKEPGKNWGPCFFQEYIPSSLKLFHQVQSQHVSLGIKYLIHELLEDNLTIAI